MRIQPSYFVAVVDPVGEFGRTIEASLQPSVPSLLVLGYKDPDELLRAIHDVPLRVPLVVVADTAARTPSVREGIFSRTRRLVPRSRGIYFSTEPSIEVCEEMLHLGLLGDIVRRDEENRLEDLRQAVRRRIGEFQLSLEYKLIERFAQRTSTLPDLSDSNALKVSRILTQMARGTRAGLDCSDEFTQRDRSLALGPGGNRDTNESFKKFFSHLFHSGQPLAQLEDGGQGMEASNGKYMDVLEGTSAGSAEKELLFPAAEQVRQGRRGSDIPEKVGRGSEDEAQQRSLKAVSEVSPEELIDPGFFARVVARDRLGRLGLALRPLLRRVAHSTFSRMRLADPGGFDQYGRFFSSASFPENKEGWGIIRNVYHRLLEEEAEAQD